MSARTHPRYNIIIDTSVYRRSLGRSDLPFTALKRLCKTRVAQLHLPYVVEMEFSTQQVTDQKRDLQIATQALDSLLRRGLSPSLADRLRTIRSDLNAVTPQVVSEAKHALGAWADMVGGIKQPIADGHAAAVMEAYFSGSPPFKTQKERKDIPDAFIFQCVEALRKEKLPLVVIVADNDFAAAISKLDSVIVYESLAQFIESKPIQAEMLELDVIENLRNISLLLEEHEQDTKKFFELLYNNAPSKLWDKSFNSSSIPSDDNEAIIADVYGEPENIKFSFGALNYYGGGEFGLPYSFSISIIAKYDLFEDALAQIDKNRLEEINITARGDHYFEAEEYLDVDVSGMIEIIIDPLKVRSLSTSRVGLYLNFKLDSMDDIEVNSL